MAKSFIRADRYVPVEYAQFTLHDYAAGDEEQPPLNEDQSIGVGHRSLRVMSLAHTHEADVAVEVWDEEPLAPAMPVVEQVSVTLRSGILIVAGLTGGPADHPIPVGNPGVYAVRVCREVLFDGRPPEGVHENLERYLIQLWRIAEEAAARTIVVCRPDRGVMWLAVPGYEGQLPDAPPADEAFRVFGRGGAVAIGAEAGHEVVVSIEVVDVETIGGDGTFLGYGELLIGEERAVVLLRGKYVPVDGSVVPVPEAGRYGVRGWRKRTTEDRYQLRMWRLGK
ncbi:hypothetical protein OHA91_38315 [Streptomyces erythrochromogenes]|uniref:Uncharacterized protein n=1 Tax=Streptomyces erythrochromogenes TaxID=285574 RepID=A0ABZ1QME1_9ACTN|nr:hypothetical protein [Streptomyces erythrochromogenes]